MSIGHLLKQTPKFVLIGFGLVILLLCLAWSALAIHYSGPGVLRSILAWVWPLVVLVLLARRKTRRRGLIVFGVGFALICWLWSTIEPSTEGDFPPEAATLARADIGSDQVVLHDIRDFRYRTPDDYDVNHVTRTYELDKIRTVDVAFSYWDGLTEIAHTFFSFGFEGGDQVVVSVEVRLQKGQVYDLIPGFFGQYTIFYDWATEEDVIGLRTNYRLEDVYLYRTTFSPEEARELFVSMLKTTDELPTQPRFYNLLFRNCTSVLVNHINEATDRKIPWYIRRFRNGLGEQRAYDHGIIRPDGTFEETKKAARIGERARKGGLGPGFSQRIRTHM